MRKMLLTALYLTRGPTNTWTSPLKNINRIFLIIQLLTKAVTCDIILLLLSSVFIIENEELKS